MRKKNMKSLLMTLVLALVLVSTVGVLAYFTDYVSFNDPDAAITIGTDDKAAVDIIPEIDPDAEPDDPSKPDPDDPDNPYSDPTPNDPSDDLTNWWAYLNGIAKVNFNPGDKMTLNFRLANRGVLDVKVRETFVITTSRELTSGSEEFKLFTAFTEAANGCNTGTTVAGTFEKIDASHYKYTIPESTITADQYAEKEYYLVFNAAASNAFQGATCTIDYLAEAMQSDGDWVTAATGSVTLGDQTIDAVPHSSEGNK